MIISSFLSNRNGYTSNCRENIGKKSRKELRRKNCQSQEENITYRDQKEAIQKEKY